jgi:hypothetical protein
LDFDLKRAKIQLVQAQTEGQLLLNERYQLENAVHFLKLGIRAFSNASGNSKPKQQQRWQPIIALSGHAEFWWTVFGRR